MTMNMPPDLFAQAIGYKKDWFGFFDDFESYVTADEWSLFTTTDGTAIVGETVGGRISLLSATASAAGDEIGGIVRTHEQFLIAQDAPLYFGARVQYTESTTDGAQVYLGLIAAASKTTTLGAAVSGVGPGPPATYDGVNFHKVSGSTNWIAEVSFNTDQNTTDLTAANSLDKVIKTAGGANFQTLEIACLPNLTTTSMNVFYWIDDILVAKHTDQLMSTPSEMEVLLAIREEDTGSQEETLVVDYAYCYQKRVGTT